MKAERKQVIISEIHYWKSHQILPAHYCDFLLALYSEGEGADEQMPRPSPYYLFFYVLHTLLLLVPILLFTLSEHMMLQIAGNCVVLIIALLAIKLFHRHPYLRESYAVMIFFVYFLLFTALVLFQYLPNWMILYSWIFLNSASWVVCGWWRKQFFLQVAGVFVFIVLLIRLGFHYF
ncbi:hypothetical protein [Gracilibacillus timonensis]|nr:hypothetical protein [Gracilibacillus timonensis]